LVQNFVVLRPKRKDVLRHMEPPTTQSLVLIP
jgi:hypothetical protein